MINRNTDFLKENLVAHRGMHDISKGIPENSILAFKEAIKHKYIIEFDVHVLKDGNVVVFHDDNLKRMTGLDRNIKDITYDEIKNLKLLNTDCYIPLLKEVLEIINGQVAIVIELKTDVKCGVLEEKLMKILNKYNGKYAVKSFSPLSVYWFKKNYTNVIRGQLSYNYASKNISSIKKYVLSNMLFNVFTKPDFISYGINSLPNDKVAKFRKNKLVMCWTVKTRENYIKGKKYCDNLIVENFNNIL